MLYKACLPSSSSFFAENCVGFAYHESLHSLRLSLCKRNTSKDLININISLSFRLSGDCVATWKRRRKNARTSSFCTAFFYCCLFLFCDSLFDFLVDEALLICMTSIFTASLFALMRIWRKSTVIATEIYGVTLREWRWIDFRGSELFAQTIGGRRTFEKVEIKTSELSCFPRYSSILESNGGIVKGYVTLIIMLQVMTSWLRVERLKLTLRITFYIACCIVCWWT